MLNIENDIKNRDLFQTQQICQCSHANITILQHASFRTRFVFYFRFYSALSGIIMIAKTTGRKRSIALAFTKDVDFRAWSEKTAVWRFRRWKQLY